MQEAVSRPFQFETFRLLDVPRHFPLASTR